MSSVLQRYQYKLPVDNIRKSLFMISVCCLLFHDSVVFLKSDSLKFINFTVFIFNQRKINERRLCSDCRKQYSAICFRTLFMRNTLIRLIFLIETKIHIFTCFGTSSVYRNYLLVRWIPQNISPRIYMK